jgi:GntR family transcriptional regulator
MKTLDRRSEIPLHVQLRKVLQQLIVGNHYEPGKLFPTEREIAERYHVSRTTIREAINDLVRLGYLTRQQGKGTFVARAHGAFDATQLSSFTEDMTQRGLMAGGQVLELTKTIPRGEIQKHFGSSVKSVWQIYRLRLANQEPIALQDSFLPANRFDFTTNDLADGSLYDLLAARYGVYTASAYEMITAAVATAHQAELLELTPGAPLLCVDRFAFSQTGEPIEVVKVMYRADRYKFFVHQRRGV